MVKQYLEQNYISVLTIFTDGSKDPETGRASAAVYVPQYQVKIGKRVSDQEEFIQQRW